MALNKGPLVEKFVGKRVGDFITDDSQIVDAKRLKDLACVKDSVLQDKWIEAYEKDNHTVVADLKNDLVLCFEDGALKAVLYCYEIHEWDFNSKRGMVSVSGHETVHHYWFDDGEYEAAYTR